MHSKLAEKVLEIGCTPHTDKQHKHMVAKVSVGWSGVSLCGRNDVLQSNAVEQHVPVRVVTDVERTARLCHEVLVDVEIIELSKRERPSNSSSRELTVGRHLPNFELKGSVVGSLRARHVKHEHDVNCT